MRSKTRPGIYIRSHLHAPPTVLFVSLEGSNQFLSRRAPSYWYLCPRRRHHRIVARAARAPHHSVGSRLSFAEGVLKHIFCGLRVTRPPLSRMPKRYSRDDSGGSAGQRPCEKHWDDLSHAQRAVARTLGFNAKRWVNDDWSLTPTWIRLARISGGELAAMSLGFNPMNWHGKLTELQTSSSSVTTIDKGGNAAPANKVPISLGPPPWIFFSFKSCSCLWPECERFGGKQFQSGPAYKRHCAAVHNGMPHPPRAPPAPSQPAASRQQRDGGASEDTRMPRLVQSSAQDAIDSWRHKSL